MHLNAPQFLPILAGVILVLLLYVFLRRRAVVSVGYFNIWKEVIQETRTLSRLRFRKMLSTFLAVVIYLLIFFGLTQIEFDKPKTDKSLFDAEKTKTFIIVDTFFETFPNIQAENSINRILKIFAEKNHGQAVFELSTGIKFRDFESAAKFAWFTNVIYHPVDLQGILAAISEKADVNDEITLLTFNRSLIDDKIQELSEFMVQNPDKLSDNTVAILDKLEITRLPFGYYKKDEKILSPKSTDFSEADYTYIDVAIEKVTQFPAFPARVEYLEIELRNHSNIQVKCELTTEPAINLAEEIVFQPGEVIIKKIKIADLQVQSPLGDYSLPEISLLRNNSVYVKYFSQLKNKKTENVLLSFKLKILDENLIDIRPDNNFFSVSVMKSNIPKTALLGDEADNDYIRLVFETLQELKVIQLVRLKDNPEIIIQLGRTELELPESAHLIIFQQKFPSLNAPSIYFWKNNQFVNYKLLQAEHFSVKKTGIITTQDGEILIDSSAGPLSKIFTKAGRTTIEFAFSISSENSDFCLRPRLAPVVFNSLISGLIKSKFSLRLPANFVSNMQMPIFFDASEPKILEFSSLSNDTKFSVTPAKSANLQYLPVFEQADLFLVKVNDLQYFLPVNSPRVQVNADKIQETKVLSFQKKNTKPQPIPIKSKRNTELFIFLIQIAVCLIFIETILHRLKITE